VFLPPRTEFHFESKGPGTRLLLFEKQYEPLAGIAPPSEVIVGHESKIPGQPFLGDPDARLQALLPDTPAFDMAVNIFTYRPGATLPFVESHIMEHGLMMLKGQGVYRLDADWHPVQAGDVIWMAPYCPQWFVCSGKTPASYIYYKDVNRHPSAG
jgi:(S)-ureidoglycine aminohydrolase